MFRERIEDFIKVLDLFEEFSAALLPYVESKKLGSLKTLLKLAKAPRRVLDSFNKDKKIMKSTVEKGKWAEDHACRFLEDSGYRVLDRNYRFMKAEVDIVAFIPNEIVFVEVRSLQKTLFGRPEETISDKKKQLLYEGAEAWLYERKMDGARIRFDVISVIGDYNDENPEIDHFKNAFWL